MKRIRIYLIFPVFCCFLSGCDVKDEFDPSPVKNFNALWEILDENYCFFEYKKIDWDDIYDKYSPKINGSMSESELFGVLSDMTYELKDGHVNILSDYFTSSYEGWHADYPANWDSEVIQNYLDKNGYGYAGEYSGIRFNKIADKKIGYIYYGSFAESILETDLNWIFNYFESCNSLIIDVRNNGGGSLTNSDRLASRFVQEKTLCGYIRHKTGKGRRDFSEPYPIYLKPSHAQLWTKPVIVITNRKCYSATNNFAGKMRELPNVRVLGGITGGGSGFPFTSEMPNGWRVRFSTSPILDINKQHTEFGIKPDVAIELDPDDVKKGKDTLIEKAIELLLSSR